MEPKSSTRTEKKLNLSKEQQDFWELLRTDIPNSNKRRSYHNKDFYEIEYKRVKWKPWKKEINPTGYISCGYEQSCSSFHRNPSNLDEYIPFHNKDEYLFDISNYKKDYNRKT